MGIKFTKVKHENGTRINVRRYNKTLNKCE